jgi:hypothetical protein
MILERLDSFVKLTLHFFVFILFLGDFGLERRDCVFELTVLF